MIAGDLIREISTVIGVEKTNKLIGEVFNTREAGRTKFWQDRAFGEINAALGLKIDSVEKYVDVFGFAEYLDQHQIIGRWQLMSLDMKPDTSMRLIHGQPGAYAEFTIHNTFQLLAGGAMQTRIISGKSTGYIDLWNGTMEELACHGKYDISGDKLLLSVAADSGPPPTQVCRDDDKLWVLYTFQKAKIWPSSDEVKQGESGWGIPPGKFLPDGFLDP